MSTAAATTPPDIIARKRDGLTLTSAEIESFVRGATDGSWADYQLSAMLMAIYLRGLNTDETVTLTQAMMHSGEIADLSSIATPKVDKHSTGGVGDKISIHLAPMIAACGVAVPMISGRGLGHTGGTLDKLESIPGFRVDLSLSNYKELVARNGCALIGQTPELAPADKRLYALRDVTATVASKPLICASIMSKKLAEGIDALVLDVKFGGGAFMKTETEARELAGMMVAIGNAMGKPTCALLTRMDEPLGHAVGNALEIAESVACLRGEGPADLMEVTFALGVEMLLHAGAARSEQEARVRLERVITDGTALMRFRDIVSAQHGDPNVTDYGSSVLPAARIRREILSNRSGFVQSVAAHDIAIAALHLGAGRTRADEKIDHAVGFSHLIKSGTPVATGDTLAVVHANDESKAETAEVMIRAAVVIGDHASVRPNLIADRMT